MRAGKKRALQSGTKVNAAQCFVAALGFLNVNVQKTFKIILDTAA
jgi:hypothetical protein